VLKLPGAHFPPQAMTSALKRQQTVPIGQGLADAVQAAEADKLRAVSVVIGKRRPRLEIDQTIPATDSIETDLKAVNGMLKDDVPSAVLVRVHLNQVDMWCLFCWYPEAAPTSEKVTFNLIVQSVKEHLGSGIQIVDYHVQTREEVTAEGLLARASASETEKDRDVRNRQTLTFKVDQVKEEMKGLKLKVGFSALKVDPDSTFERAVATVSTAGSGAVLASLKAEFDGKSKDELKGEVLEGVKGAPDLVDKLPKASPCYVILFEPQPDGKKHITLLIWEPEEVDAREKVIVSTMKTAILACLPSADEIFTAHVSSEDDLKKELILMKAEVPTAPLPEATAALSSDEIKADRKSRKSIAKAERKSIKEGAAAE